MKQHVVGNFICYEFSEDEIAAALAHWTDERLAAAQPIEQILEMPIAGALAEETLRKAKLPESEPDLSSPTRADVSQTPYIAGGKFYGETPDGKGFTASAQIVGNSLTLMTAAHCVVGAKNFNGKFFTKLIFKRAWDADDPSQSQTIAVTHVYVDKRYYSLGQADNRFDYAFLAIAEESDADYKHMTFENELTYPIAIAIAIGYPANYGNSDYMYEISSKVNELPGHFPQMLNNPMGEGCSGGAWFAKTSAGEYAAIGLNSFGLSDYPDFQFGPFFDGQTNALLYLAMGNGAPVTSGGQIRLMSLSSDFIGKEKEGVATAPVNKAYFPTLTPVDGQLLEIVLSDDGPVGSGDDIKYGADVSICTTNGDVGVYKWLSRYYEADDCFYYDISDDTFPNASRWQLERVYGDPQGAVRSGNLVRIWNVDYPQYLGADPDRPGFVTTTDHGDVWIISKA